MPPGDVFEQVVPRWLRVASFVAALLTIPSVLLDAARDLPDGLGVFATALNWSVWSVFLLALLFVLFRAPHPWAALKSNPVLPIIVVLTIPLAPAGLQIFRVLRLGAAIGAAKHAQRVFSLEGLRYAAAVLIIVVVVGGALFAAIEREQHLSIEDGIWWAIVTVTTVGYGDIVPKTEAGRALATMVMAVGIGTAALIVGAASQRFVSGGAGEGDEAGEEPTLRQLHEELRTLRAELAELRGAPVPGKPDRPPE